MLETQTEDSAWTPIHSAAVDKCVEVLKPDLKNIQEGKRGHKCNRVAVLMLICLNGQYFAMCPEKHFQNESTPHNDRILIDFADFLFILFSDESCKKFQEHIKTCPMPKMGGPWGPGHGKKGFGGRKGGNFRPDFGSELNFGTGHFGPGHFGPGHFGPGRGGPPNFGTGEVFGFL